MPKNIPEREALLSFLVVFVKVGLALTKPRQCVQSCVVLIVAIVSTVSMILRWSSVERHKKGRASFNLLFAAIVENFLLMPALKCSSLL